jgi:hypothetical protein
MDLGFYIFNGGSAPKPPRFSRHKGMPGYKFNRDKRWVGKSYPSPNLYPLQAHPVIPWQVAPQQSLLLFHRTIVILYAKRDAVKHHQSLSKVAIVVLWMSIYN